jgi:hypothetical protein
MNADETGVDFGASAPMNKKLPACAGYRHRRAAIRVYLRSSAVPFAFYSPQRANIVTN